MDIIKNKEGEWFQGEEEVARVVGKYFNKIITVTPQFNLDLVINKVNHCITDRMTQSSKDLTRRERF